MRPGLNKIRQASLNVCRFLGNTLRLLFLPQGGWKRADHILLRWVLLCTLVLLGTGTMMMAGCFTAMGEWQVEMLLGRPFYMEAEDVQVSLLTPGTTFAICTAITLYLALLLPRLRNVTERTQVCFLAGVAALLPGMVGTLWHGVLYVAPFLFCIALLWVLTLIPFFTRHHHP